MGSFLTRLHLVMCIVGDLSAVSFLARLRIPWSDTATIRTASTLSSAIKTGFPLDPIYTPRSQDDCTFTRHSKVGAQGNLCGDNVVSESILHHVGVVLGIQYFHDPELMKGNCRS
jgi:hypothetical protein